ncbi:MAG: 16S rRNA (guanine(966)-N(2))-methyltransferase RsmD [Candidatus Omnitrophota bacterium]|nr:MAG: 16S rRNA (guanine(966)-N(2))-methyltransferase RsmD [Candidatus Omnitrophota bacterium]
MKIISGKFKGCVLKNLKVSRTRPTSQKVRKAIFDVLGNVIENKSILDLFSGTGSLGFEALSRGAKNVTFVEKNKQCLKMIKDNARFLKVTDNCRLAAQDVFAFLDFSLQQKQNFQIIFADPPYYYGLTEKLLHKVSSLLVNAKFEILVLEHYKKDILPHRVNGIELLQIKKYGDTFVSFYLINSK